MEIRIEKQIEYRETENVIREAFWNVYAPGCDDHYMVHQMRNCEAFVPELNLVAIENGKIIGHVINIESYIMGDDGIKYDVLSLGPISVLPQYQRKGIGAKLVAEVKRIASELGYRAVLLCGNPAFYTKQGFEAAEKYGIRNSENMYFDALHICGLYGGALEHLSGKYFENEVYNTDPEDVKRFDADFPPKEMLSGTPTQQSFLEMLDKCRPYEKTLSK